MTTWFWMDADKNEHGPIAPDKLLMLIRQGEIARETLVRKDSSSWCRSEQINGLWDNAAKPYKVYMCVECGHQIDRPPSRCAKCERRVEKANEKMVTPNLNRMKAKAPPKDSASKPSATAQPGASNGSAAVSPTGSIQSVVKKAMSLRDRLLPKSRDTKK